MMSSQSEIIYHMTPLASWEAQLAEPGFAPASLANEGFIHCTAEPEILLQVANRFYRDVQGPFIIVSVAPERLVAEVRWERADGHLFPHIYGVLNRGAVDAIMPFPQAANGDFILPPELTSELI